MGLFTLCVPFIAMYQEKCDEHIPSCNHPWMWIAGLAFIALPPPPPAQSTHRTDSRDLLGKQRQPHIHGHSTHMHRETTFLSGKPGSLTWQTCLPQALLLPGRKQVGKSRGVMQVQWWMQVFQQKGSTDKRNETDTGSARCACVSPTFAWKRNFQGRSVRGGEAK